VSKLPKLSERHTAPQTFPPGVAFMDGQYLPISEAKISVLDYGFLHSDATYDVAHVWRGAFFRLNDHLGRFFSGLDKLHMSIPYNQEEVSEILGNCVALSGLENAYVEFICTRGSSPTFSRDPRESVNRFIAFAIPFSSVANPRQMNDGMHVSISDIVRISPQSVDPTVKNYHWLDLVKGIYQAYERGAETTILVDSQGYISEGPGYNIFAVRNGEIFTPQTGILMGITRKTVFDICAANGMKCMASNVSTEELKGANEVFITSTAGGIIPVTRIDCLPVGEGVVGPITKQLTEYYWQMHDDDQFRTVINYFNNAG